MSILGSSSTEISSLITSLLEQAKDPIRYSLSILVLPKSTCRKMEVIFLIEMANLLLELLGMLLLTLIWELNKLEEMILNLLAMS